MRKERQEFPTSPPEITAIDETNEITRSDGNIRCALQNDPEEPGTGRRTAKGFLVLKSMVFSGALGAGRNTGANTIVFKWSVQALRHADVQEGRETATPMDDEARDTPFAFFQIFPSAPGTCLLSVVLAFGARRPLVFRNISYASPKSAIDRSGRRPPDHAMLVPISLVCLVGTLVTDVVYWRTANMM
jgi:hypothetical protein